MEVLTAVSWWAELLSAVPGAREILLASYIFDHGGLTEALLQRLGGRAPFKLTLLVDDQALRERTSRHQRPRLAALRRAGAEIYACAGEGRLGCLHLKAVCVGRRLVFTGSANFTDKSLQNTELHLRFIGRPVASVLAQLLRAQSLGREWDGN